MTLVDATFFIPMTQPPVPLGTGGLHFLVFGTVFTAAVLLSLSPCFLYTSRAMSKDTNKPTSYAVFLIVLSSILSSIGTIFYDEAIEALSPIVGIFSLNLAGGVILLTFLKIRDKLPSFELVKKHTRGLILLTLLRSVIGALLFAYGLEYTDSIKVIFFTKIEPYLIMFWYWCFRGQKVSQKHFGLLTIHICGAIILSTNGVFKIGSAQIGDLLVLLAMACFALTYIQGKETSEELGALTVNAITSFTAGIFWLPFAFYLAPVGVFSVYNPGWYYLGVVLILFQILGLTLWFVTLGLMRGWMVSALRTLGPIVAAPFAFFLFNESLSLLQIGSAAVVLATSALIAKEHVQEQRTEKRR